MTENSSEPFLDELHPTQAGIVNNAEGPSLLKFSTKSAIRELTEIIDEEKFVTLFKEQCRTNYDSEGVISEVTFSNLHFSPGFQLSSLILEAVVELTEEDPDIFFIERYKITFNNCELKEANLYRWADGVATFTNTSLENADLREGEFKDSTFENSDLTGVDLTEADLRETIFDNCNLRGALFKRANMKGASIMLEPELRSKYLIQTQFDKAIVKILREMLEYGISVPEDYSAKLDK